MKSEIRADTRRSLRRVAEGRSSRSFDLARDGTVVLKHLEGRVEIEPSDDRQVHVEVVKRSAALTRRKAERLLGEMSVRLDPDPDGLTIVGQRESGGSRPLELLCDTAIDLHLHLPDGAGLEVSSVRGDILLRHVNGRIRASSVHGEVRLQCGALAPGTDISLASTHGDVLMSVEAGGRASLTACSTHGPVVVETPAGGTKRAPGASVDEEIGGGGGRVRLSSVNGSVRVDGPSTGREEA